jgi:hypothetical protein
MPVPDLFRSAVPEGALEIRTIASLAEARAAGDGAAPRISGLGSPYGVRATLGGSWFSWDEEVSPGAWRKTIGKDDADIRSMFNHDPNQLLGRTTAKTLELAEDDEGLHYDVQINTGDTSAMDTLAKVERGDVTGASVWFRVISEKWTEPTDDNGLDRELREILEAELYEVGPVVFPAFPTTTAAAARSFDTMLKAAGVTTPARRASLTVKLLTDPAAAEEHIRTIFERNPQLREATCNLRTAAVTSDGPTPPPEKVETSPEGPSRSHLVAVRQRELELIARR